MIYQWDLTRVPPEQVIQGYWGSLVSEGKQEAGQHDTFADQLLLGVARNIDSIDQLVRTHAEHWRLERMSAVDRNILRLATYELLHCPDVPVKVALNEAIELGKRYSTAQSGAFINGLLDRIKDGRAPAASPPATPENES